MTKLRCGVISIIIFSVAPLLLSTQAQQPQPSSDPIAKLLELPAPLPDSAHDYFDPWENKDKRPPIPGDDAPLDLLVKYWWRARWRNPYHPMPSETVRRRLLEAAEKDPDDLWRLLDWLPDTPEAHDRVKALLDQMPPVDEKSRNSGTEYVHEWLMTHSRYFRDELVEQAGRLNEANGYIHNEKLLIALARLDWKKAQPVLEHHLASGSPRRAALALSLQYTHAVETSDAAEEKNLRERLQKIATDTQAPGYARAKAGEALLKSSWPGRDDWYLSLFNDKTLQELRDGPYPFGLLALPLIADPNKWIPGITKLVSHPDRAIHDAAVSALLQVTPARRETLLPLLPWLADPNWTSASGEARNRLLWALMDGQIPECVPGLIAIVETGREHFLMQAAVRALATYHALQAGPTLKKALAEKRGDRYDLVKALVKCDALTDGEKLAALEKYARHVDRINSDYSFDYSLVGGDFDNLEWNIGSQLSYPEDAPLALTATLLERVQKLQKDDPNTARNLLLVIQRWPTPVIFKNIIERIANGTVDDLAIRQLILHRDKLRASVSGELAALINRGGYAAGIAAALLSDKVNQQEILSHEDHAAQYALLACARLVREELPLDMVSELYRHKDERLRRAAERYLEIIDSVETRALILATHPNEALILGGQYGFDPRKDLWFEWEEKLREEIKQANGPDEILAMGHGSVNQASQGIVLRWRGDKVTITKQRDQSREEVRELSDSEVEAVRGLLHDIEFDHLPPLIYHPGENSHAMLFNTEFVRIRKSGGRRVFTNTVYPEQKGKTPYQRIYNLLDQLTKADGFELRYYLARRISGLEVLYAGDEPQISYVCLQDGQVRALVEEQFKGPIQELVQRQSQGLDNYDRSWRLLQAGKLGATVTEPAACPVLADKATLLREVHGPPQSYGPAWQSKLGSEYIRAGYLRRREVLDTQWGLWRFRPNTQPEQIASGSYVTPIVTRDGKWVVAGKQLWEGSKVSQEMIRIDLKTLQEHKTQITVTLGYDYQVIAEIIGLNKVLVCRVNGQGSNEKMTDCSLVDPTTGKTEAANGEFRPLHQQTFRSLQATAGGTKFWAAIPDDKANRTQLGLYDAKKFAFTSLLELPEIQFNSMQMWVDEAGGHVYIAYQGHALRLPVPKR